jgi:hypothetical protein
MKKEINSFIILFLILNLAYAQNGEVLEESESTKTDEIYVEDKPIEIVNKKFFNEFFNKKGKGLLMIGENHSSSVASKIYPELIEYHYKENDVKTFLIEFGPAEAYFYAKYLATGNEKLLNYTIYAGYYKDWKKAWKKIYELNNTLEEPLDFVGIDFDRSRIFGYALFNILKVYEDKPKEIDSLLNKIKSQEFYETYTVEYPTEVDIKFVVETKELLKKHFAELELLLTSEDLKFIERLMQNHALGFNEEREKDITKNVVELIETSEEQDFLMLVGRDHTYLNAIYDDKSRLANNLKQVNTFETLSGLILHENSQQWGGNFEEEITLFEMRDKIPWKNHYEALSLKSKNDITVIPLEDELDPLTHYVDFVIVARNLGAIQF